MKEPPPDIQNAIQEHFATEALCFQPATSGFGHHQHWWVHPTQNPPSTSSSCSPSNNSLPKPIDLDLNHNLCCTASHPLPSQNDHPPPPLGRLTHYPTLSADAFESMLLAERHAYPRAPKQLMQTLPSLWVLRQAIDHTSTLAQCINELDVTALADALRTWHAQPPPPLIRHRPSLIDHLHDALRTPWFANLCSEEGILTFLHQCLKTHQTQPTVWCHGDFHPHNLLCVDSTLVWVDWEHTHLGSPWEDVMMLAQYLPEPLAKQWIDAYSEHDPINIQATLCLLHAHCAHWALSTARRSSLERINPRVFAPGGLSLGGLPLGGEVFEWKSGLPPLRHWQQQFLEQTFTPSPESWVGLGMSALKAIRSRS